MASNYLTGDFTISNALATLLTTESLLFAALGMAFNVAASSGRRIRNLPVPGAVIGAGAVAALAFVACGAAAAWWRIFGHDFPSDFSEIVMALAIASAIVAEPVIAVLLGLGLRVKA